MYQVGDQVMYGVHGVCRVVDQEERTVERKPHTYLVLEPLGQEGARFFVPTRNEAAMAKLHPILSKEGLEALLASPDVREDAWICDENQRKQRYRELISSADRKKLMRMVRTLYQHKAKLAAAGRRCHVCDENFLRDAEKLLTTEFSVVLDMEPEKVRSYIRKRLES